MSVEAITWALKMPIPSSSAKFVLVVLANCASAATGCAHPSLAYIAEATGQDRKTVIANLAKLREWGLIEDTGERHGATKQVIEYRLRDADLFEEQAQKRNRSKTGTVPKKAGNSPVFPRKQSQKRDTEPSGTYQEPEKQKQGASAPVLPDWLEPDAWAMWHRYRNTGKGWTADAKALSLRKLAQLRDEGHAPRAVIEQSIERGWTGLFPIRADFAARTGPQSAPSKSAQALMNLEGLKRESRMATGRDRDGAAEALPALAGPNPRR